MAARVMICGAADTRRHRQTAAAVLRRIGADPTDYVTPGAAPITDGLANNIRSSMAAVKRADLIVFIVQEQYGHITWQHELAGAINQDIPILVFVHRDAYVFLRKVGMGTLAIGDVLDAEFQRLMTSLMELHNDTNRRIFEFDEDFGAVFNASIGGMFEQLFTDREELKDVTRRAATTARDLSNAQSLIATQGQRIASLEAELARRAHLPRFATNRGSGPAPPSGSRQARWGIFVISAVLLLMGGVAGFKLGGAARNNAGARSVPTITVTTSAATPTSGASDVALEPGLACGKIGWVTYFGLFDHADGVAKAEATRAKIEARPAWHVPIHLSTARSMCSTGFAVAFAQVPANQVVLWSDPLPTRPEADSICSVVRGAGIGCFPGENPMRVKAS